VHLHLLLNHLPVVGIILVAVLFAVAFVRRSNELTKVALAILAALAGVTVAVFFTGEPAEELVENLPGISEAIIERHEEVALFATIAMAIAGTAALFTLFVFRRRSVPRSAASLGFVGTLCVWALMAFTANLGGQIRHSEIGADATATTTGEDLPQHGESSGK
jgi:uncharacterized membrane protein